MNKPMTAAAPAPVQAKTEYVDSPDKVAFGIISVSKKGKPYIAQGGIKIKTASLKDHPELMILKRLRISVSDKSIQVFIDTKDGQAEYQ